MFVQSLVWLGCLGMSLTFLLPRWVDMPSPGVCQAVSLLEEVVTPRKDLPPLLLKLNERPKKKKKKRKLDYHWIFQWNALSQKRIEKHI